MSIRRSLALRILNGVVRFAPAGAGEWSEAMLHEVDFIESDWAAVSWALAGTRMLFTHYEVQVAGSCPLPWSVEDLARKVRRRTVFGYTLASSLVVTFVCLFYLASTSAQRIGCCLGIAAMFYTWGQLFALRVRRDWPKFDSFACAVVNRTELERQRDFYRGFRFWSRISIVVSGVTFFCIGGLAVHPEVLAGYATAATCLIAVLFMAVWLNLRETRKFQAQIERLNSFPPK
jgi:hypothetical protein